MAGNIYFLAKGESRKADVRDMSPENVLYVRNKPADYFIMILEGRARIIVTKENQEYDTGPFYCFGLRALMPTATKMLTNSSSNITGDVRSDGKVIRLLKTITNLNIYFLDRNNI